MSDEPLSIGELRTATLGGLRWAVVSRPLVELLGMASMVVLARLVAPAYFGRFAIALIVLDLGSVTGQGVCVALVQRRSVTREHLQAGLALAILSGLGLAALTVVAARLVVQPIYGGRTADLVVLIAPLSFIGAASNVPQAILQRRLEFRRLSALSVLTSAVTAGTSVPLAFAGLNGAALVLGLLAGASVQLVALWLLACPPPPRLRRAAVRDLLGYGGPASVAAVAWVGFRNCDYAIIGARLGPLQAGLYYRAYALAVEYQKKVSRLMDVVGFPLLSRAGTREDQRTLRGRMVRLETLVLFPALTLLAIVAPVLIPWVFGARWESAVLPTQILSVGGAATLVIDAVGAGLMATGRARALLGFGWGHFVAYASAVLLATRFGIAGVAVAAAVVHGAFVFVAYVLLLQDGRDRRLGLLLRAGRELWDDVQPATICCAVAAAVAIPLALGLSRAGIPPLAFLVLVTAANALAYLITMRILFPASLRSLGRLLAHLLPALPGGVRPARLAPAESRVTS